MKLKLFLYSAVAMLTSVACSDAADDVASLDEGLMVSFKSAITTRATDTAFESDDKISVTAYDEGSIFAENIAYSFDGESFSSSSPITLENTDQKLSYRAVYPYVAIPENQVINFSVQGNQSEGPNYTLSDLLTSYVGATSSTSPKLTFDHLMTKVVVNVVASDIEMMNVITSLNAVASVEYNLLTLGSTPVGDCESITMASNGVNSYKAIIAPQTIGSTDELVNITIDGRDYMLSYVSASDLMGGKQYTINVSIADGTVKLESAIINDWEDGRPLPSITSTSGDVDDIESPYYGEVVVKEGIDLTLYGENMNNVNSVYINPSDRSFNPTIAPITNQTDSELSVTIPRMEGLPNGYNSCELEIFYFDENESSIYDKVVNVYSPEVCFYEDVFIPCRSKSMYTANCYGLNTGTLYENSVYATELDPVACLEEHVDSTGATVTGYFGDMMSPGYYANTTILSPNVSVLSEESYNSVEPYIYLFGLSSGSITLYSPAGSNNLLRNYYIDGSSTRIYGSTKSYMFAGTPIITYRFIDPATSADSSRELLKTLLNPNTPKGCAIDKIDPSDPDNFAYYDAANQTLAGLNINIDVAGTGLSYSMGHLYQPWGLVDGEYPENNDAAPVYPNSQWTDNITGESFDYEGRVVMVNYHAWKPADATNLNVSANADAASIKQMGFLIIKEFYYPTNTQEAYIKGDLYWQREPLNFKNGVLVD